MQWSIPYYAPSAAGDPLYIGWLERAQRRALRPAMAAACFDITYRSSVRDILPAIRVPTLVVHRSGNTYLQPRVGRHLADTIPDVRYVEVDGVDHVPYLGDTTGIIDAIEEFLIGDRTPTPRDRVLKTLLFTDLIDSTSTAARLGDLRWRHVISAHYDMVRAELIRSAGQLVDTAGDGVFGVFDGPERAVQCALRLVTATRSLGMELWAGVHTGECEIVDNDFVGLSVHAARVAALAKPSQVLVSQTVKDLVAGSELHFEDQGCRQLKGVPEELNLYALASTSDDFVSE